MYKILLLIATAMFLSSCEKFMYHPNEVRPQEKDLNAKNIARISQLPTKDDFKFILIGDTQRFYDELEDFTRHVNNLKDIDFILLDGDLVDFGLNNEYNWIAERLLKINIPFISALGNHDMLANGKKVFNKMFGPDNFSFSYGLNKFIVINTNSRETGFDGKVPDIPWLQSQYADEANYRNIFVLSHVAPMSTDFDKKLEVPFYLTLQSHPKTRISLHGHEHQWQLVPKDVHGVTYLLTGAGLTRDYALVSVTGETFTIEEKFY